MIFRASYSVLALWSQGQRDEAVRSYFKLDRFETQAMRDGKRMHKEWEEETKKTGCSPLVFGGEKLIKPFVTERKMEALLFDWMELVGVIDRLEPVAEGDALHVITDYKSGKTSSADYVKSFQGPVYHLLCHLNDIQVGRVEFRHFDQYKGVTDTSILYATNHTLTEGLNWVATHGSEMHDFLKENGLYDKYGSKL